MSHISKATHDLELLANVSATDPRHRPYDYVRGTRAHPLNRQQRTGEEAIEALNTCVAGRFGYETFIRGPYCFRQEVVTWLEVIQELFPGLESRAAEITQADGLFVKTGRDLHRLNPGVEIENAPAVVLDLVDPTIRQHLWVGGEAYTLTQIWGAPRLRHLRLDIIDFVARSIGQYGKSTSICDVLVDQMQQIYQFESAVIENANPDTKKQNDSFETAFLRTSLARARSDNPTPIERIGPWRPSEAIERGRKEAIQDVEEKRTKLSRTCDRIARPS